MDSLDSSLGSYGEEEEEEEASLSLERQEEEASLSLISQEEEASLSLVSQELVRSQDQPEGVIRNPGETRGPGIG